MHLSSIHSSLFCKMNSIILVIDEKKQFHRKLKLVFFYFVNETDFNTQKKTEIKKFPTSEIDIFLYEMFLENKKLYYSYKNIED